MMHPRWLPWFFFFLLFPLHQSTLTPSLVAKYLNEMSSSSYMSIGCIGLLFDINMDEKARAFMLNIRMNLKSYQLLAMMVTEDEMQQLDTKLCLRQHTLIVVSFTHPRLLSHLTQYLSSPEAWNYRKWMVLMQSPPENMQENEWIEKHFPLDVHWDSEIFILLGNQKLGRIFRLTKDSPLLMKHLGVYDNLIGELDLNLNHSRIDLKGINLRIGVQNSSLSLVKHVNGELKLVSGVYANIWRLMENEFNFTTQVIVTSKHGWFKHKNNGHWDSIESLLLDGTIDAAVTGLVFSPAKSLDFFITPTIYRRRYFFYVRDPNKSKIIPWDTFTAPFSKYLWIVVGCTIICISVTLYLMSKFFGFKIWLKEEVQRYTLPNCLFSIYRAFCNQGQEKDPRALSSRVIFITAYLTAMLVLTSYSGVLISFLTTGRDPLPFESLEQILNSGSYQIGARDNTSAMNFFKYDDGVPYQIYQKLITVNPLNAATSNDNGLKRVCSTNFAYVVSSQTQINLENYPCKIIKLNKKYIYNDLAIAFNRTFRLNRLLTIYFQQLIVHGIISKIIMESDAEFKLTSTVLETPTVEIGQVTPLLAELAFAVLLSFLFLFTENIYRRIVETKRNKFNTSVATHYYLKSEKHLKLKPWINMRITS